MGKMSSACRFTPWRQCAALFFLLGVCCGAAAGELASVPATSPTPAPSATPVARQRFAASGEVKAGQGWERQFGGVFRLVLRPNPNGWDIEVREDGREENLARLTPPFHSMPNPREIEGWHFRNADNTGPNQGDVNAFGEEREFIFSPEVGRTIQGPHAGRAVDEGDVARVETFGRGKLVIHAYRLTDLKPGVQASFAWMQFSVELTWPTARRQTQLP